MKKIFIILIMIMFSSSVNAKVIVTGKHNNPSYRNDDTSDNNQTLSNNKSNNHHLIGKEINGCKIIDMIPITYPNHRDSMIDFVKYVLICIDSDGLIFYENVYPIGKLHNLECYDSEDDCESDMREQINDVLSDTYGEL